LNFLHTQKNNLISLFKNKDKIRVAIADLETTGLEQPIEITQLGIVVIELSYVNEILSWSFLPDIEYNTYFNVTKDIEPKAIEITSIAREGQDIPFGTNITTYLNDSYPIFNKNILESFIYDNDIDFLAGHNFFGYDYNSVLKKNYSFTFDSSLIFDTMLFGIYFGDFRSFLNQTLNKQAKKIIHEFPDSNLNELISSRSTTHDALIDVKVNSYLFISQLNRLFDFSFDSNENTSLFLQADRSYSTSDVLVIKTDISDGSLISPKSLLSYCSNNGFDKIIFINDFLTDSIKIQQIFKDSNIDIRFGLSISDDTMSFDIVFKDLLNYRLALPIFNSSKSSLEKYTDLKKYTKNFIFTKLVPSPFTLLSSDNILPFVRSKFTNNEMMTAQEILYHESHDIDFSIENGLFTSDFIQSKLNILFDSSSDIDFKFYRSMNLSAFPPLFLLTDDTDIEPSSASDALVILKKTINRIWKERDLTSIINNMYIRGMSNKDKLIAMKDRIDLEFKVLEKLNNVDYIKYFYLMRSVTEDISFGPGRGSAAGSIIAYIMEITHVNPEKYSLLFFRFMDPDRPDYPDIDVDIINKSVAFNKLVKKFNKLMKSYENFFTDSFYSIYDKFIIDKYIDITSNNYVGKVSTSSRSSSLTSLGDLLRLNSMPYFIQNKVSREFTICDDDSINEISYNVSISSVKDDLLRIYPLSFYEKLNSLNDLHTNFGIHPGGVIFYPKAANTITPLHPGSNLTTVFDKKYIEDLLLIKMDLLGLSTRNTLNKVVNTINELIPNSTLLNPSTHDFVDGKVLTALQNGYTSMTFQMESKGMRNILKKISPIVFEDCIAVTALYRPGPLGSGAVDVYMSAVNRSKREKYNIPFYSRSYMENLKSSSLFDYQSIIDSNRKKLLVDYDPLQLEKDSVILNIICTDDYFESKGFSDKYQAYFNDEQGSNETYDNIISNNSIDNPKAFVDKIRALERSILSNDIYLDITRDTYGTLVYQEQIMLLSTRMAGFTGGESNMLRKVIAKSKRDDILEYGNKIISGLFDNDQYDEETGSYLFDKIVQFGAYAFNKSHSAAYTFITWETQWYKEYYPEIYYSTALMDVPEKHKMSLISEILDRNISIEIQRINNVSNKPIVDISKHKILVPFSYIKGLGDNVVLEYNDIFSKKPNSIEEMIMFNFASYPKTIVDKLGIFGSFDDEDFSFFKQYDFFYNSDKIKLIYDFFLKGISKKLDTELSIIDTSSFEDTLSLKLYSLKSIFKSIKSIISKGFLLKNINGSEIKDDNDLLFYPEYKKILDKTLLDIKKNYDKGIIEIDKKKSELDSKLILLEDKHYLLSPELQLKNENKFLTAQDKLKDRINTSISKLEKLHFNESEYNFLYSSLIDFSINDLFSTPAFISIESKVISIHKNLALELRSLIVDYFSNSISIREKLINSIDSDDFISITKSYGLDSYFKLPNFDSPKWKKLNISSFDSFALYIIDSLFPIDSIFKSSLPLDKNIKDYIFVSNLKEGDFTEKTISFTDLVKVDSKDLGVNKKEFCINSKVVDFVIYTDFLPKVDSEGFCTIKRGSSQSKDYFEDLLLKFKLELGIDINIVWKSYYDQSKVQYEEFSSNIESDDLISYENERKAELLELLNSNISLVFIAGSNKTFIRSVTDLRERGFIPEKNKIYNIYYNPKNSTSFDFIGTKVIFTSNIFPYKELNSDMYFKSIYNFINVFS
jgi:hypothetical protein